ncbi:putative oxidoreductase [Lachnellula suecica]|uniref:Putative oxidoreductase n=1 Tax=Lachnellula suecica TaxID=602035 RepID=A0A8T9C485_9HELO|nr:putative oxidoreductase [Lachnellula suecica]
MVLFRNILIFASSVSALRIGVGRRDVQTFINDFDNCVTKSTAFKTAVDNYNGGVLAAIPISTATNDLQTALNHTTSDVHANPSPLSSADFNTLAPHIGALVHDIDQGLTDIKGKRDLLKADGLIKQAIDLLTTTQTTHDSLADAITFIFPVEDQQTARDSKAAVDGSFADVIMFAVNIEEFQIDFGDKTEGKEVVSAFADQVRGKTILITGVGPNGLGATFAETLAAEAPRLLILTARSSEKVETVQKKLSNTFPGVEVRVLLLDVSSFDSIRRAAAIVNDYPESIDILINNAGVMNIEERTTNSDGFEMHLATNYLGAFLFTNSIMRKLVSDGGARIVNLSSSGYIFSPFRFADYNFEGKPLPESEHPPKALCEAYGLPWGLGYLPTIAYGQSKTALMLFSTQLAKSVGQKGITSVCVHPGAIATDLWRHTPRDNVEELFKVMPMKTHSQGVSTILVGALDPKLAGSESIYLEDCQLQEVAEFARDAAHAERLWELSEELVGEFFSY